MTTLVTAFPINELSLQYVKSEDKNSHAKHEQDSMTQKNLPNQPLPGSSISLTELWRLVEQQMKTVADAVSGTTKDSTEVKKSLIELQRDSQLNMLKERETQLEQQQAAQKSQSFWSKLGMALGFIAAILIAPFNPVMSAVMIGTMVASIVVPKIADEIMKSAGVPEETRSKVKMGLEISIGLVGMLASFNPVNLVKSIASNATKAATAVATKVANVVDKALDAISTLKSVLTNISPSGLLAALGKGAASSASKVTTLLDNAADALRTFQGFIAKGAQHAMFDAAQAASKALKDAFQAVAKLKDTLFSTGTKVSDSIKSIASSSKQLLSEVQVSLQKFMDQGTDLINQLKNVNPTQLLESLKESATNALSLVKTLKALKPHQLLDKARKMLEEALTSIKNMFKANDDMALKLAKMEQITAVSSSTSSVVGTGYGIKSAAISKDMEITNANQEELATRIDQILTMLEQAMRAMNTAMESVIKTNSDARDFNKTMVSIHL